MARNKKKQKKETATKDYVNRLVNRSVTNNNFVVESTSLQAISTTVYIQNVTDAISRGVTAETNRVSDEIKIRGIDMSLHMYPNGSSTFTSIARLFLVQWNVNTSIASPTALADILYDSGTAPAILSFYRQSGKPGRVLWDSGPIQVGPYLSSAGVMSSAGSRAWLKFVRVPGKKFAQLKFNEGADTGKGQVFLIGFSDRAAGTNPPELNAKYNIKFTSLH